MNFTIRDARIEDMEQVLSLIQELAIFEKEPNAVVITVEDLKTIRIRITTSISLFCS